MMFLAGGSVVVLVLILGIMQSLGETRLVWIFPALSMAAVLAFLAHCMFVGPEHQ